MSSKKDKLFEGMKKSSKHRDDVIMEGKEYIYTLDVNEIKPNPYQPRKTFSEESLKLLGDNIKQDGQLQPIIVERDKDSKGKYILIAGERRLRASKRAGLDTIKAIVKDMSDIESAKSALWENILREDLSNIEKYYAIKDITTLKDFKSDKELAETVNMPYASLRRLMSIGKLGEKTKELYVDNHNDVSLELVEKLSSMEDEKSFKILTHILENGLSGKSALKFVIQTQTKKPTSKTTPQAKSYKLSSTKTKFSLSVSRKNLTEEKDKLIDEKIKEIENILKS